MRVFFTKRAERNFIHIKETIREKWGEIVADAFEQKTIDFIEILQNFPELGSVEYKPKQIRGFQLTKQTRVFYKALQNSIVILSFFDVRQDPNKKAI